MTENEREYLDRVCGFGFRHAVESYRRHRTSSLREWAVDTVRCTTLTYHEDGCNCLVENYEPWVQSMAMAKMVHLLIDEAAVNGVDGIELMERHKPDEFSAQARTDPRIVGFLDEAQAAWNRSLASADDRMRKIAQGQWEGMFAS